MSVSGNLNTIGQIYEMVNPFIKLSTETLVFEQGGLSGSTGMEETSATAVRTGYYYAPCGFKMTVPTGFKAHIFNYPSEDGTGYGSGTAQYNLTGTINWLSAPMPYMRIVLWSSTNGTEITPSDIPETTITLRQKSGGDYGDLSNKPQIAGVTLSGNKSLSDLGIAAASAIPDVSGFYTKPNTGIPASDLASGVIPDVTSVIDDAATGALNKTWSANKIASELHARVHDDTIASGYNETVTYSEGDYMVEHGELYQAIQDISTPEEFNPSHWQKVNIMDAIEYFIGDFANEAEQYFITEPASDGTPGQVLTTDGQGGRSWTTVSGGGGGSASVTYVTPEDYGAVGDGVTDDTTAVQNAINYGSSNKIAVKGYKKYNITSPLTVDTNHLDLEINRIEYTGTNYCISITGSYNNFKFEQLYCSNSKGIVLRRPNSSKTCSYNKISGMRLYAKGNAVEFDTNELFILYNKIDIRAIQSDTADCYHCDDDYANENIFMNSTCLANAGWAIYKCSGRFYNFTLEGNVLNGIYMSNGNNYFAGFRVRELVDKIVQRINGDVPDAQGGTLIKYANPNNYMTSKFVCDDAIPYEAIDVSDMYSPEYGIEEYADASSEEKGNVLARLARLSYYQEIDAPIRYGSWDTQNGYVFVGRKMYVHGGRKICVPYCQTEYTITDADYDMRDAQVALDNAKIYPTKMIIGVNSCVIHLPASYCPAGYSEFIVDQTNHICTIYDYNNATTPIFNGAARGTGVFRLKANTNFDNNAITKVTSSSGQKLFDSSNYTWEIERIDGSGGGSVSLNYVTPEQYGAIGDGVTDDSQAVQDACDAGYNVYFSSNKTYYLASTVTIDHDIHLYGGENTVIKTATPSGGTPYDGIVVQGTLKKTTTLTTDYTSNGNTDNCNNKFTLTDMTDIDIGDIMVVSATDQHYHYAREYYYLGGTLLITDVYDGHIYTSDVFPYSITNTANVSVKIYDAPKVFVENLTFQSNGFIGGTFRYLINLLYCNAPTIRDCIFTQMSNGFNLSFCANAKIENVSLSKSKYDNALSGDGYGIVVDSCTNTVIERVMATCAQHAIAVTGHLPAINTYVSHCELTSECRSPGLDTHEAVYNLVVEDCVLGTAALNCVAHLNRCRIINNRRTSTGSMSISVYGSHEAAYSRIVIENTKFEGDAGISIMQNSPQTPVQSFDNLYGEIRIENCSGGTLNIIPTTNATILSNTIQNLVIKNWKNCKEIYRMGTEKIINMTVEDSTFTYKLIFNDHNSNHGVILNNIEYLNFKGNHPMTSKLTIDRDTRGECLTLPEGVQINVSSNNSSAKYVVCGSNLTSNNANDYCIGTVSGSDGGTLSRTVASGSGSPSISFDSDGNLIHSQGSTTSKYSIYPVGMFYVKEFSTATISATVVNSGATSGATFLPMIAIVDASTGTLIGRYSGTSKTASSAGESLSYSYELVQNVVAFLYLYCSTAVANSETTFEDFSITCTPAFAPAVVNEPYTANRRTGDGVISSLAGVNNIMCSDLDFHVNLKADYIGNPIGLLSSATGVNF